MFLHITHNNIRLHMLQPMDSLSNYKLTPSTFPLLTVSSLTPSPPHTLPFLPSPSLTYHLQVSPASRSMLTSTAPSVEDMLREKRPEEAILQLLRRRISLSHSSRSNDWGVWRVGGVEGEGVEGEGVERGRG